MSDMTSLVAVPDDGPFYDDLEPGMELEPQPAVTIDSGLTAYFQTLVGEVFPLALDHRLSAAVTGNSAPLVSAGAVVNLSIGQSTVVTRRAIANLFYRNMRLSRPVHLGETLHTRIRIVDMADASPKPNRANRGKVLIGIQTTADDDLVLDYQRCALLPVREGNDLPGFAGDTGAAPGAVNLADYADLGPSGWDATRLPHPKPWEPGETRSDITRDVVDGATGLVRLTHNRAIVHRDAEQVAQGTRLVYGGHVQALAQASLTRLRPTMATVVAWHACNHVGPAWEGDLLSFDHTALEVLDLGDGMTLRAFETVGYANRDGEAGEILRWISVCAEKSS